MEPELPIAALRASFLEATGRMPVVVSSPTGSGKSTEVPRWCRAHAGGGLVLVVEPRRVACRTLAARVADLEGTRLGADVGYIVRDDTTMSEATRIVFATPGIVLRDQALADGATTIILDEFHERTLDVDLLLALLLQRRKHGLVIMSATLDGDRVARHVEGVHLSAEVRTFPVDIRYLGRGDALPDPNDLTPRIRAALDAAAGDPGDILVFLPGKAEIEGARRALDGGPYAIVPLHGGLTLDEQRRAFDRAPRRKVILATNVAETSVTIPGVGVVIDAGLVRQTRYHDGRGSLVLAPIADDAAAQRAGRAGRMAAGVCYRLWSAAAALQKSTPPEIHRESLVPFVMSAAAWGERPEALRLLDAPKPYALEAARADLRAWGILSEDGAITEGGRGVYALPLDPFLGRLLVEARTAGCLEDAIDLVSALAVGRPLFNPGPPPSEPRDDLRLAGCDVTALVTAVRAGRPESHHLSRFALDEARRNSARLRKAQRLEPRNGDEAPRPVDVASLSRAAMIADPRVVHVARPRGRDRAFSNGGTELELARESAVQNARDVEAVVVLDTRAFGAGRATRLLVTCATPISLAAITRAGIGADRLASVQLEGGLVLAKIERVLAERVIGTREEVPTGEVARAAIATLFLRGSIFRAALATTRERLALRTIAGKLAVRGHPAGVAWDEPLPLEAWVARRLLELGVESGTDLAMLSAADLTMPELSYEVKSQLEREFPLVVSVGDATYRAEYDLDRSLVMLHLVKGHRTTPPPLSYLPRFAGLRICIDGPRGIAVVRERQ